MAVLTEARIKIMKVADLRKNLIDRGLDLGRGAKKSTLIRKLIEAVAKEKSELLAKKAAAAKKAQLEAAAAAAAAAAAEAEAEAAAAAEAEAAAVADNMEEDEAEEEEEEEEEDEKKESEDTFEVPDVISGPDAQATILAKLESKNADELTPVEQDILSAKARNAKFTANGEAPKEFEISEEARRKLREQRFGPITVPFGKKRNIGTKGLGGIKKPKMTEVIDDEEKKKRDARATRFAQTEDEDGEDGVESK